MWPPPPPPCPPPPPRACASVARRLPASTALAKTNIIRPLILCPFEIGGTFRYYTTLSDAGVSQKGRTPTWIGTEDGYPYFPSLLNSLSITRIERPARAAETTGCCVRSAAKRGTARRRS